MKIIWGKRNAVICWYFDLAGDYRSADWCWSGIFPFTLKKNPTSVSTGGVLGCPNNWRSLDSRTHITANAVPKWIANSPVFRVEKSLPTIQAVNHLSVVSYKKSPARLSSGGISRGKAQSPCVDFLTFSHFIFDIDNRYAKHDIPTAMWPIRHHKSAVFWRKNRLARDWHDTCVSSRGARWCLISHSTRIHVTASGAILLIFL